MEHIKTDHHHMEMTHMHFAVERILDQLDSAEEHLEHAYAMSADHPDWQMHIKEAEDYVKGVEEWIEHKSRHIDSLPHDCEHSKAVKIAWKHKLPMLHDDLAEIKYDIHHHKAKGSTGNPHPHHRY